VEKRGYSTVPPGVDGDAGAGGSSVGSSPDSELIS
jgi:hypothetical protein